MYIYLAYSSNLTILYKIVYILNYVKAFKNDLKSLVQNSYLFG